MTQDQYVEKLKAQIDQWNAQQQYLKQREAFQRAHSEFNKK